MICWGGKARNPKIQRNASVRNRVLSQELGFQIIMKIKKVTVEQKKKRDEEERDNLCRNT